VYDDDIDMVIDEDEPEPQGGNADGSEGGVESSRAQATPPKKERYDQSLTRSRTEASSSSFDEAHFYGLNWRLDAIDEQQQKHVHDQQELLCQKMEFDHRQQNLEHHIYYVYKHYAWPYPRSNWRLSGLPVPY